MAQTIPKILHQIWLGPLPRPKGMTSWPAMNWDWSYRLWTEDDIPPLRNQALFDAFHDVYHAQADILRYEILYEHGGVYLDADSFCLRALPDSLRFHEWACAENDRGLLANGFLGMYRKSPLMAAVMEDLAKIDVQTVADEPRDSLKHIVWVLTGPACLSEVVKETNYPIHVYPGRTFIARGEEVPIYARHTWDTTRRQGGKP
jgi:mannosyltransferase OCH1-like enzyme